MVNHYGCGTPNFQKGRRNVKLEDLPEEFIENVNAVLQEYDDKVVERFEIKIEFEDMLIDELNNWVTFAVQSRTKNLAFDLVPDILTGSHDRYMFPFHLLDEKSVSGLQSIQLSYISFKPPLGFKGFPSLRKLDLNLVHVNRESLEVMLHSCHNPQWLSLVRCYLDGKLHLVLSHLRYIKIFQCKTTMVEVHTAKLDTFIFDGHLICSYYPKYISCGKCTHLAAFQDAVATLLKGIPSVRNLTLHARWLLDNRHSFSNLRHLQLLMNLKTEDANKIHYAVSLIRAAPLIEKLEVHFGCPHHVWFSDKGYVAPHLEQHEYSYLKNMHITGYKGERGQLEFLKDVVENAPALESVTIENSNLHM
uniref:At1g61320/AtMIF1 LRR domain-containing protein n=1 Tax=Oryza glumipatula TaxID=40148 RepID=A0A0E0AUC1_9ORYZ